MQLRSMKRREFILLVGSTAAWPFAARAQQSDRVKHIGVLSVGNFPLLKEFLAAFRRGLELAGWSEGRNVQIDVRFDTPEQVNVRAQELVALQPDVILACTTPAALAVQRASRTIPIIFVAVSDPVGAGLVANLARPGANLSGVLSFEDTITGKWLAMLKEIAPHLERVALVANPKTSPYDYYLRAARMIGPSLALEIVPKPIEFGDDIEQTIASLARMINCGLVITPDTTTLTYLDLIVAVSARHRVPAVYYDKNSCPPVVFYPMASTSPLTIGRQQLTWTASYAVPSQPIFRCRHRPNTKPCSTLKPRRRLG